MAEAPLVLVVDDEQSYRDALRVALEREGFRVEVAVDGPEALERFDAAHPSLVLLDVMLPKISGVDVCREIRTRSQVPIIMVTARNAEIDAVVGLEVGADDYVTKPFRLRELVARVRAALRRGRSDELTPDDHADVLEIGDVRLDAARHEVAVRGERVALPLKEFELLELLLANAGRVLDARRADRPRLGSELLRRHQDARRAREASAGQDRGRPRASRADRDCPRRRLPLREGIAVVSITEQDGELDHTVPWAIAKASFRKQRRNDAVTEIAQVAGRGHSLTIDHGWREVADQALSFVQRFADP